MPLQPEPTVSPLTKVEPFRTTMEWQRGVSHRGEVETWSRSNRFPQGDQVLLRQKLGDKEQRRAREDREGRVLRGD